MDIKDLYRDVIIDHNRAPRNFRRPEAPTHQAEGINPLCGDRLNLYLTIEDGVVRDAAFEGSGCAISVASSSLLTEALRGKTEDEALALFETMHALLTGGDADLAALGKLGALAGVHDYPTRVKCAALSWHALKNALAGDAAAATTE